MLQEYKYCVNCGNAIRVNNDTATQHTLFQEDVPRIFCKKCWPVASKFYGKTFEETKNMYEAELDTESHTLTKSGIKYIEDYLNWLSKNSNQQTSLNFGNMNITSGFNFEGYKIKQYQGFVSAEVAIGLGLFKGIAASAADIIGAESTVLGEKLSIAKESAITNLKMKVSRLGGNAIIGMDLDYTMFGGSLLGVIASGTAVMIEKTDEI